MDFDDLDDAEADLEDEPNEASDVLEPQLCEILAKVEAPDSLACFLRKQNLCTCLSFWEYAANAEEVDKNVTAQLLPPCEKKVPIRNAWRHCQEPAKAQAEQRAKEQAEEQKRLQEEAEQRRKRLQEEEEMRLMEEDRKRKQLEAEKERKAMEHRRHLVDWEYSANRACNRCAAEMTRNDVPDWKTITIEQVLNNHERVAPGMIYGMEFPWTEAMLLEWGPKWLTKAFRKAGTLSETNEVVKIIQETKTKVTTGNNGAKFLFEVTYKHAEPDLHTKLFAKIPHPMDGKTNSHRLSSSVHKQPAEYEEINTYRLLEATLPVKIPTFYYGDVSNETSNFIIITECVPFCSRIEDLDFGAPKPEKRTNQTPLKPYEVEGPYDKCIDWTLRSEPSEYYYLLLKIGAKMAGLYKCGKLGNPDALNRYFENWGHRSVESWGMNPAGSTGEPIPVFKKKLEIAMPFFFDLAKDIFPKYVTDSNFQAKFEKTLLTLNAYAAETSYWRHKNPDFIAMTHNNLNVDNAFWWRDEDGKLDIGLFDWGHMSARSIGFKIWWWVYCGDHDTLTANLDCYLQCFIETYHEYGGPLLDKEELKTQLIITAMEQMLGLVGAVPQIHRMVPKKNWQTIKDRWDPRIAENVQGQSTLRLYLHVMDSIIRIMQEWKGSELLQDWVGGFCKAANWELKAIS